MAGACVCACVRACVRVCVRPEGVWDRQDHRGATRPRRLGKNPFGALTVRADYPLRCLDRSGVPARPCPGEMRPCTQVKVSPIRSGGRGASCRTRPITRCRRMRLLKLLQTSPTCGFGVQSGMLYGVARQVPRPWDSRVVSQDSCSCVLPRHSL